MNITDYKYLNNGMKSFTQSTSFPIRSNTYTKTDANKSVLTKSDTTSAALELMDLGQFPVGTVISFCVEVRATALTAGSASMSIESRTGPSLLGGRKIVNSATSTSLEWEEMRCDWIVAPTGRWITLNYGASTTSNGTFEFRRPRLAIKNEAFDRPLSCNLQRVSGVWSVDTFNFIYKGIELVAATGDSIEIKWPYSFGKFPLVQITVDTGFALTTAGFISAGPYSCTNTGCKIKLIKTDGTFVSDVTAGGNVRLHVSVMQ